MIFPAWPTVAAFCRAHGFQQTTIGAYLNLSVSPYLSVRGRFGHLRPQNDTRLLTHTAERLCQLSGLGPYELFEPDLYDSAIIPRVMAGEMDHRYTRALTAARTLALPPMQETMLDDQRLRATLETVLKSLTPQEQTVIRERFGLNNDEHETSLKNLGHRWNVTPERIRQIEIKALQKLRHPSRSRRLRPFLIE